MANTYNWNFVGFDCYPEHEGLQTVVFTIHWRLAGENDQGVSAEIYGTKSIALPDQDSFIPYENLTKDIVLNWMGDDVATLQNKMDSILFNKTNPTTITQSPPWE